MKRITLIAFVCALYPLMMASEARAQSGVETQLVPLSAGWNLISLRVLPEDPALPVILNDVLPSIALVKDERGRIYDPGLGVDQISPWDAREAYYVFVRTADTLTVAGTPVSQEVIALQQGWNLVPYPSQKSGKADAALASVKEDVGIMTDAEGRVYAPSYGIDAVGDLKPGAGYRVYAQKAAELVYPADQPTGEATYAPACIAYPGHVLLEDYGTLTFGAGADSLQRAANSAVINRAIAEAPLDGAVCLPEGRLYLGWDQPPKGGNPGNNHIRVSRDRITIWGTGACGWGALDGCSYLATPGGEDAYRGPDPEGDGSTDVIRGAGLGFTMKPAPSGDTLRNIVLRGFELDGQAGNTGNYSFNYRNDAAQAENGWDLSHKGITLGGGGKLMTDILIEDVKVHHYRGEIIYAGGFSNHGVTMRRVWSYGSNGSAHNFATTQRMLVEDSKFGNTARPEDHVRFWAEYLPERMKGATGTFRRNRYEGCSTGNGCIAMAVDNAADVPTPAQTWTFEENDIDCGGQRAFLLKSAPYNFVVKNNQFTDCSLWVGNRGHSDPVTATVTGNTFTGIPQRLILTQSGYIVGAFTGNTVTTAGRLVEMTGGGNMSGFVISGNTFAAPSNGGDFCGACVWPRFEGNDYGTMQWPKTTIKTGDEVVQPRFDGHYVAPTVEGLTAVLGSQSADGQVVELINSGDFAIAFPASATGHGWDRDLVIAPGASVKVVFDRGAMTWSVR